ncbi:MAG: efflux RND transporter periplasmic adaptor subunit [Pseudomonadota bacterium]
MPAETHDTEREIPESESRVATPKKSRRWIGVLVGLCVFMMALMYLWEVEDTVDVTQTDRPVAAQPVTVEYVTVSTETAEIVAFAEVRPRWSADIRAAIFGRIEKVFDAALEGERVEAGTRLVSIENSGFVADVAEAELAVRQAELELLRAQKATKVARKQFKNSGTSPPNELAVHLPQLRIAEFALESGRARLVASRQRLTDSNVRAPFSGYVTKRMASPGQSVNVGDALLSLVDDTTFEMTVSLGRREWLLLKKPLSGLTARVLNQTGEQVATARVRQGGGFLDKTTRQYQVFLEIDNTDEGAVLSGDFVRVVLPGISVTDTLNLPASSMNQEGHVWAINDDNRLQRISPYVLFRRDDRIVIHAPDGATEQRVAVTPLVSFLPGQRVQPISSE